MRKGQETTGEETNLIKNGSFEETDDGGVPVGWQAETRNGRKESVEQTLTVDVGRDGQKFGKLLCTKITGANNAVMAAQFGIVGLKQGQFYHLTWWAKGGRAAGEADPLFSATTELAGSSPQEFQLYPDWRRYERDFRVMKDFDAKHGRFAFVFKTAGVLWFSDVSLTLVAPKARRHRQWLPQIGTQHVTNFIPNSSFECGVAGWGGFGPTCWAVANAGPICPR